MELIVKLLPYLLGMFGAVGLWIGKRVYDSNIKAKERQAISTELLKAEKQATDSFLAKEKTKAVHSIPILERVPDSWGDVTKLRPDGDKVH